MTGILEVEKVTKTFSHFVAIKGISLTLEDNEILALIGPNGSGKTTFINVVSGIFEPDKGTVNLNGRDILGLRPYKIVHLGLNRTFQTPKPFNSLTVSENVKVALIYGRKKDYNDERKQVEWALEVTGLSDLSAMQASNLNTFHKKMLDLARAIVTSPKVLLVDELAAGLSTGEMSLVRKILLELRGRGISIIVVEHVMSFIQGLAERIIVMDAGEKIFEGEFEKLTTDEKVKAVYLGRRSVV